MLKWVLPVPGGPNRTTFSLPARKSSCPRCSTLSRRTDAWKLKSNSSKVFLAGKRAALMRPWPPWLSRLSTSVLSRAAANRSKLQSPPGRARRAWAAPGRRPAPSGRGTGARVPRTVESRDQRVVAGQRADLDRRLALAAVLVALALQRAGVLERGDRPVARERPDVSAGQFARVQRDRGHLAVGHPGLDA